jgi:hypothetical protein
MSSVVTFWVIVSAIAFVFFLLALRELLLLLRLPPDYPERGLYWFNMLFLFLASIAILCGGYYLDLHRRGFEKLLMPPPHARYAVERNALIHDDTWVYVSASSVDDVRTFYRTYAETYGLSLIEDDHGSVRMSFALPSGNLFLTLTSDSGETVLYFSRIGEIRTVEVAPLDVQ